MIRLMAGTIILAVTLLRVAYLLWFCPLDLAPDEAHYWDWSRHLDWSYYSKGPLVAWLIHASVALFGPVAEAIQGTMMPAVRLPAVLCGSGVLAGLFVLTKQVTGDERRALAVMSLALTIPVIGAGALLMTIDAPFACLWVWALVFGYEALFRQRTWAWPLLGLFIGLGILAKYTMALWLFSFGLFCLLTPAYRDVLWSRRFWGMIGMVGVSCLPILIWNVQNDFVTFRHVAVQAGVANSGKSVGIRWLGPLEYLGGQFGLLLGYWFIAWFMGMVMFRPGREPDTGFPYLWWMSLPTFALFGIVSFKAGVQINWPVTAYLSGMILGIYWVDRQVNSPSTGYRTLAQVCLIAFGVFGLSLIAVMHDSRLARPLMLRFAEAPSLENPFPLRKFDPTCRLKGWHHLAKQIDTVRERVVAETGSEPVIAGLNWMMPGEIGFYCKGHPPTYSVGLAFGDRHSQYDHWHPNPIDDAQAFAGKAFIIVGQGFPKLQGAFGRVEMPLEVVYDEDGHPLAGWTIWVAHGFRGFRRPEQNPLPTRY